MARFQLFAFALFLLLTPGLDAQEKQRWLPHNEGLQKKITGVSIPLRSTDVFQEQYDWGVTKKLHPRYGDPIVEAEIEEERERNRLWAEAQLKLHKELKLKASTVQTDNFIVHWAIKRWKVGSSSYSRVKAAHLYAKRCEDVAKRFEEIVGKVPGKRQTFWFLTNAKETMRVTLVKFGSGSNNGMRQWSTGCQSASWPERTRGWNKDDQYWSKVVHDATEMMAQGAGGFQKDLAPWLWVGLAHFIERETFGNVRNFDFSEGGGGNDRWIVGGWPKKILSYVNRAKEPSFAAIAAMPLDSMTGIENAMAWSFIDFLVTEHPEEFKKVFSAMKSHNDSAKAIDQGLNMSTASFHEQWRKYVQRSYVEKR